MKRGNIIFGACVFAAALSVISTLSFAAEDASKYAHKDGDYIIRAGAEYFPMGTFTSSYKAKSALDFSGNLDAPAGKYGFVKAKGDSLFFEKRPQKKVRFFGTNLCDLANYPTHENAELLADEIAKCGYNIVRFHHFDNYLPAKDSPDGAKFDADRLDRLHYLFYALKKRGIYVTMDLYISRQIPRSVYESELPFEANLPAYKSLFILSPAARKNFLDFSRTLLESVNPYTSLPMKDDPALVSISLVNENTPTSVLWVFNYWIDTELFPRWVQRNRLGADFVSKNKKFLRNLCMFEEYYSAMFREFKTALDAMGVKAMISDRNHCLGFSQSLAVADRFDYVDQYVYFHHPSFPVNPWRLPAEVAATSPVLECAPTVQIGVLNADGKPFSCSEWNDVGVNEHSAEGAFLMGAYAAFQGWDMFCRFDYTGEEYKPNPSIWGGVGFFSSRHNPADSFADKAFYMMFLRGDVAESSVSIPVVVARDFAARQTPQNLKYAWEHPDFIAKLGLVAKIPAVYADTPNDVSAAVRRIKAMRAPLAVASEEALEKADFGGIKILPAGKYSRTEYQKYAYPANKEPNAAAKLREIAEAEKPLFNAVNRNLASGGIKDGVFKSSTGQLTLDSNRGIFTVVSPRSEGFVLPENFSADGAFAKAKAVGTHMKVFVSSLDALPLAKSRRLLIINISHVKNSGMRYADGTKTLLKSYGSSPVLVRRGTTELELRRDFAGFSLYALSPDGSRIEKIPFKNSGGSFFATLKNELNGKAVFVYELVAE